jgi:hypothetical protein
MDGIIWSSEVRLGYALRSLTSICEVGTVDVAVAPVRSAINCSLISHNRLLAAYIINTDIIVNGGG